MDVLEKTLALLSKHSLCDHCLGRQFALLGYIIENKDRGKALKLSLTLQASALNSSKNAEGVKRLKVLALNGFSREAQETLRHLKKRVPREDPSRACFLCEGKFQLLDGLEKEEIDTRGVKKTDGVSGIANILLSEGDNRIIVVPGANHELANADIDAQKAMIKKSSMVILQLELPISIVEYTLQVAKEVGVPTILNPAPAAGFTEAMKQADFLTPNETEAEELFGTNWELELERYPNRMVVTLGKNGARYFDGDKHVTVEGFPTTAVDTTGAGDTFNGALAVALSEGSDFKEAVRFANAAASLSVEKFGAQGGMPNRQEVVSRMEAAQ